jgi:hypothetical protein
MQIDPNLLFYGIVACLLLICLLFVFLHEDIVLRGVALLFFVQIVWGTFHEKWSFEPPKIPMEDRSSVTDPPVSPVRRGGYDMEINSPFFRTEQDSEGNHRSDSFFPSYRRPSGSGDSVVKVFPTISELPYYADDVLLVAVRVIMPISLYMMLGNIVCFLFSRSPTRRRAISRFGIVFLISLILYAVVVTTVAVT